MPRHLLTRRQFVASGVLAAAPGFLRAQNTANRLNIAVIGVGGRGGGNLQAVQGENIVALCDVSARALDAAAKRFRF